MSKLTVKEYATLNKVTVQSVYKKLKIGTLNYQEINNIRYIIIDDEIDYEKKFTDLQLKYDATLELWKTKNEIIDILKSENKSLKEHINIFKLLLPSPKNKKIEEVKETKLKKKKSNKLKKKKNSKNGK